MKRGRASAQHAINLSAMCDVTSPLIVQLMPFGMPYVTVLCMYVISICLITALPYMTPSSWFFNHSNIKEFEAPEALIRCRNAASRFVVNVSSILACYSKSTPMYYLSMWNSRGPAYSSDPLKQRFSNFFFKWGPLSLVRMFYGPPYSWDYQTH